MSAGMESRPKSWNVVGQSIGVLCGVSEVTVDCLELRIMVLLG